MLLGAIPVLLKRVAKVSFNAIPPSVPPEGLGNWSIFSKISSSVTRKFCLALAYFTAKVGLVEWYIPPLKL